MNTLIYSMGAQADDTSRSFGFSEDDSKKYTVVKGKFDGHFIKRRNVIFERAKFNMRAQEEGESVDGFIIALYELSKHCGYGELHDEMIRDRLVVGLKDLKLSEKLQLDPELTLEKVVTQVCQAETVKEQQPLLRGEPHRKPPEAPIGAVLKNKKTIVCNAQTKGQQMSEQRHQKATDQGGENVQVVANRPFMIVRNVQHAKLYVISADRKVTFNQYVDLQMYKESVVVI